MRWNHVVRLFVPLVVLSLFTLSLGAYGQTGSSFSQASAASKKAVSGKKSRTKKLTVKRAETITPVTLTHTDITLSAQSPSVWLNSADTLSGVLTFTDLSTTPPGPVTPLQNVPVQIQMYVSGNDWQTVATVNTDGTGAFSTNVAIKQLSARFRAVYIDDVTYQSSMSSEVIVTGFVARTKISYAGPAKVTAESVETYRAHLSVADSRVQGQPAVAGAKILVYSRDAFDSQWQKPIKLVTDANGNVSWRTKVSTPTYWMFIARETGTTFGDTYSAFKPTVKPAGTVYTLPASAPKPTYLAPQPAAVGTGANPVVRAIPDDVWRDMTGKSWHAGCPVGRNQLAIMYVNYWGFDGYRHRGEMVFRASHKSQFVSAFTKIYRDQIPLHGMYRSDRFGYSSRTHGADDYASMRHDNTSTFNCRWVDGNPGTLSPHSYGTAVDINPYENPYHSAVGWTPNAWWAYKDVSKYTWKQRGDVLVKDMTSSGFSWTYGTGDSQHFDAR